MWTPAARALLALVLIALPFTTFAAAGRTATSFEVSQTGESNYSIPIFTPPGTNGMTPQLAFVYGHRNGNTLLGVGWDISGLSVITRCGRTWAQDGEARDVRNDWSDKFCLDGMRLRLDSGTYGQPGGQYRTEIDTFARIVSAGIAGNGPTHFSVEHKNGLIYEYGESPDSRIESLGQTTVRAWALNKIRDRDRNEIVFSYTEDVTNGSFRIDHIEYTQNPLQGLSPQYRVQFSYETKPSNEIDAGYLAGSPIREVTRLTQVDVTHSGTIVRRYVLDYEDALSSTSRSRLEDITECGGSSGTDCLPQTLFGYQNGTVGLTSEASTSASVPSSVSPWGIDVNGDGRDDLVYSSHITSGSGHWMVMLAGPSGGYSSPVNTSIVNNNYGGAIPIDYNADGLADLLVPYSGGTWWVMLGTASGLASPSNTGAPATGTGNNAGAADIDGDGLEDLVWAETGGVGDAIRYRRREWGAAFSATATTLAGPMPTNWTINHGIVTTYGQPSRRRLPDFNGDGRTDIFYATENTYFDGESGQWITESYWNFLYTGRYTQTRSVPPASPRPVFPDLNGDGMSDLFYKDNLSTGFWTELAKGDAFTTPSGAGSASGYGQWVTLDWDSDGRDDILVPYTPGGVWHLFRASGLGVQLPVSTGLPIGGAWVAATVSDINGDGLDDIGYRSGSSWVYRLRAGAYPDLLQTGADGHGNLVTFNYAPLPSANYSKYADATFPAQDYQGSLYVVNSAVAPNGIGGTYTKDFHYYGARLNLQGRGLEGFYARRTYDSRNGQPLFEHFHRAFPYTGLLFDESLYQPGETARISHKLPSWTTHTYSSLDGPRFLPFVQSAAEHRYEVGGAFNAAHISTVSVANSVDSVTGTLYDSTVTTTELATANGVQSGASYVQRTYHPLANLFNDFGNWCFGRPGVTQQINSHNQYSGGSLTRQVNTSWHGPLCRPTQQQIQPADPQLQVTVDLGYDGYGNLSSETVTGIGLAARTTSSAWAAPGSFPTSITRPVSASFSEATQLAWNYALGVQASETDPNGISVSWLYDNFGRKTQENRPDGTDTTWSYNNCGAVGTCQGPLNKLTVIETRRDASDATINDRWVFLDTFDRIYLSKTRSFSGAYNRVDIAFDALGRIAQRSAPCWDGACTFYWTTYQYDLLNRPTQESRPVSDTDPTIQTTYLYYEGLKTRIVDPQSKQKTTTVNVVGAVARSTDHLGYYQSFDYDAFGNPVRVMDSSGNTLQSGMFNVRGMRTSSTDLDMGAWMYVPNALGEIASQTDANGKTTSFQYDWQSRPTQRTFPEATGSITATWTWGQSAAAKNIGQLASSQMSGTGITTYTEANTFDSIGRPSQTTYTEGANNYLVNIGYSASTGFIDTLTYPTSTSSYRLKLQYDYQYGQLLRVKDFQAPTTVFWQANTADARGLVIDETLGNGLRTTKSFDLVTGLVDYIRTGPGGGTSVQNLSYLFDKVGNLTQRQDGNQSLTENFFYDDLYRLDYSQLNGATNLDLSYNAYGNILTKAQAGVYSYTYTYHPTKIHAVTSITGTGPAVGSYAYDAAGNMTSRLAGTISWYANNLPKQIRKTSGSSTDSSEFQYAPSGMRWRHAYRKGSTLYTHVYVGALLEKVTQGTNTEWKHSIHANGEAVALLERHSNGTNTQWYLLKDHLGSTDVIANNTGGVFVRESNDAFGKRRGTNWTGAPTATQINNMNTSTRRGFTFHEHLDSTELIHMNGRVYDPNLGRFISADPFIDGAFNTQGWNRYSYVKNNPLSAIDPSGFTVAKEKGKQLECESDCPSDRGSSHGFNNTYTNCYGGCDGGGYANSLPQRWSCVANCGSIGNGPISDRRARAMLAAGQATTGSGGGGVETITVSATRSGHSSSISLSVVGGGTHELLQACAAGSTTSCNELSTRNQRDLAAALDHIQNNYPEILEDFEGELPSITFDISREFWAARAGATGFWSGDITLSGGYDSVADLAGTVGHELLHSADGIFGRALTNFQDNFLPPIQPWGVGLHHAEIIMLSNEIEGSY